MRTLKATQVRTHCYRLLTELEAGGEAIEITKNGVAIARLIPIPRSRRPAAQPGVLVSTEVDKNRQDLADAILREAIDQ